MVVFKYGILVGNQLRSNASEWRIAIFGATVNEHTCILVTRNLFNFLPALGITVKLGFSSEWSQIPNVIEKCRNYEWIRDVKVIDSTVVIFAIVRLTSEQVQRVPRKRGVSEEQSTYYIIDNLETDFKEFCIPKFITDREIAFRSNLQKPNQPLIYRVGIIWDPTTFENGRIVNWRYHRDHPMAPIFELYYRDAAPPYLAESMVYGALEGLVIAKNGNDSLIWSPNMGCAVLAAATTAESPELGSVHMHLIKRMLPDTTFGFSCSYELVPGTIRHEWNDLRIVADSKHNCVYLECSGELARLQEKSEQRMCMIVPHIGKVTRGMEMIRDGLTIGNRYRMRLEFRKTEIGFEPVIVDLQMNDEHEVNCRIVYISPKLKTYFAVLDCLHPNFERYKTHINFIIIPFRTLLCSVDMYPEDVQLMKDSFTVTVPKIDGNQKNVDATHVKGDCLAAHDDMYRVIQGRTWLRTVVTMERFTVQGPIELLSTRLAQKITDFSRLSERFTDRQTFAVHAQFALAPTNKPMFLVRHVALTLMKLPRLDVGAIGLLPPLRVVFASLFPSPPPPPPNDAVQPSSSRRELYNDRNSTLNATVDDDRSVSPTFSIQTIPEDQHPSANESAMDRMIQDFPTILEESMQSLQSMPSIATTSEREGREEVTLLEPLPEEGSENSSIRGEIITESCLDRSSSTSSSTRRSSSSEMQTVIERQSLFGYNLSRTSQAADTLSVTYSESEPPLGFGPSSYVPASLPPPRSITYRRKPLKFGIRMVKHLNNHNEMLYDIVYRHSETRPMFVENLSAATNAWMSRPIGTVTSTKKRLVYMYGVEMVDCREANNLRRCPYAYLVRFYTRNSDVDPMDRSVVMPSGGLFPELPQQFKLGTAYSAYHFVFHPDRMVRIGGYAKDVGCEGLRLTQNGGAAAGDFVVSDKKGHQWMRMVTTGGRPETPVFQSEVFELWDDMDHDGYIIVEKTPSLMKVLEAPDAEAYVQTQYKFMMEPLAGGPVDVSQLKPDHDPQYNMIAMWRMVVEFSDTVFHPILVQRIPVRVPTPPAPHERALSVEERRAQIAEYGYFKTMAINQKLAQERMDRLRALGDPRVKRFDGPALAPEMDRRNVHVNERRELMMNTLKKLKEELDTLHEKQYFVYFTHDKLDEMLAKYEEMHDDNHQYQFKKRTLSVVLGCNILTDLLLKGDVYKEMHRDESVRDMLKMISECLGLNSTYIKKSEPAKKLLHYLYKNKLHTYF